MIDFDFTTVQGAFQAFCLTMFILFGGLTAFALIAGINTKFR